MVDASSNTLTVISFDGYMDPKASGTGNKKINLQISDVTILPSKTSPSLSELKDTNLLMEDYMFMKKFQMSKLLELLIQKS